MESFRPVRVVECRGEQIRRLAVSSSKKPFRPSARRVGFPSRPLHRRRNALGEFILDGRVEGWSSWPLRQASTQQPWAGTLYYALGLTAAGTALAWAGRRLSANVQCCDRSPRGGFPRLVARAGMDARPRDERT
jgi:hypothetical protein